MCLMSSLDYRSDILCKTWRSIYLKTKNYFSLQVWAILFGKWQKSGMLARVIPYASCVVVGPIAFCLPISTEFTLKRRLNQGPREGLAGPAMVSPAQGVCTCRLLGPIRGSGIALLCSLVLLFGVGIWGGVMKPRRSCGGAGGQRQKGEHRRESRLMEEGKGEKGR